MQCVICGQPTVTTCLCGFCPKCIQRFTHEGCHRMMEDREEDRKKNERRI